MHPTLMNMNRTAPSQSLLLGHAFSAMRGYSTEEVSELLNKHSGLKGLCGFSDNRDVEARFRTGEHRAQLAKRIQVRRL